jgi:hypothetical protein
MPLCKHLPAQQELVDAGSAGDRARGDCGSGSALAPAKLAPDIDATGRLDRVRHDGLFGALFAVAFLPGRMTRPYRYRVIDGSRGIVMFAAKNPQYTAMLVEQAHRASGVSRAARGPAGAV